LGVIETFRRVPHGIALPLTIGKTMEQSIAQIQSGVKTFNFMVFVVLGLLYPFLFTLGENRKEDDN